MNTKRLENAGFKNHTNIKHQLKVGCIESGQFFSIDCYWNGEFAVYDRTGEYIFPKIHIYHQTSLETKINEIYKILTGKTLNFETPTPQSPYKGHEARIKELEDDIKFIKEYMGLCIKDKI